MRILIIIILSLTLYSCSDGTKKYEGKQQSVASAMGSADTAGFEKAMKEKKFEFPKDNGAHPTFRTEWWYFTGNLTSKEGKRFGYQFTIFRNAIAPLMSDSASKWRSNQIYMGHFAVTDIDNNKFYYFERFSRDGNRLAGAEANPLRVWIEDWEVKETEMGKYEFPNVRLIAKDKDINLDLELSLLKPMVLQGQNGLSQKSKEAGNASYYYSATRIETKGSIKIEGKNNEVEGSSWLDREWSTSALADYQKGWDWFSLQLDNNVEIMYYQLRNKDGSVDETSKGSIVFPDGKKENIKANEVELKVIDEWKNAEGKVYPSGWTLKIPSRDISLTIRPAIKNQELNVTVKYWEGSVIIEGTYLKEKITGRGYTELTGYED
ncbi:MAG: lipocalin-like domain-containing protein [Ignavibacteria bacterium]